MPYAMSVRPKVECVKFCTQPNHTFRILNHVMQEKCHVAEQRFVADEDGLSCFVGDDALVIQPAQHAGEDEGVFIPTLLSVGWIRSGNLPEPIRYQLKVHCPCQQLESVFSRP